MKLKGNKAFQEWLEKCPKGIAILAISEEGDSEMRLPLPGNDKEKVPEYVVDLVLSGLLHNKMNKDLKKEMFQRMISCAPEENEDK